MFLSGRQRPACIVGWLLLMAMFQGTALAAVPLIDDPAVLLQQADTIKTSDHPEFLHIMKQLVVEGSRLPEQQQLHLRFLQAWELGYEGHYDAATPLLNAVIAESKDVTLGFRARTTLVNMLSIGSHYEDAFTQMSRLLGLLPQIIDRNARIQALGVASMLYNETGQYDLGLRYANQMVEESPVGDGRCKGSFFQVQSLYESGKLSIFDKQSNEAINACNAVSELLFANAIRVYLARAEIQNGQSASAIELLRKHYSEVKRINYPELTADVDSALAQAYWSEGQVLLAKQYAQTAVGDGVKHEFTKSNTNAYELLYLIAKKENDPDTALAYHEKYMAADKGYLNAVSAKALAYQTVKQRVMAKKQLIDTLNKQNQILTLEQKLAKKATEASRLYIALLLTVLAFIAFVAYRIKRSQLRFMRLARRDGLTGLFNRQHFLDEAQRVLQYCRRSSRPACLVLIDLDHFKDINDTHGHVVGDDVLKRAVQACQAHLRSTDIFGRLGGEEFGILLPECPPERAVERVELLRLAVAVAPVGESPSVSVSASFGVAGTSCSGYELRQLLIHADDALYQAKNSGRNRVVLFDASGNLPQDDMRKSRRGTPAAVSAA